MREQHGPGIADPVVEANMPLGRIGFKVRGDVIDLQCHDAPLKSQTAKVPSAKPDIGRLARPHYPKIAKKCPVDAIKKVPCRCYNVWVGPGRGFQMQSGSPAPLDWPLLEWHRVLDSRDAEETRAFYNTMAFRFDLAARDAAQLDACVSGIYLPGIYIGRAQYGAPVALGPSRVRNDYWVHLPIRGMWEAAAGYDTFVCDSCHATVSSPTREVMLRCNAGAARLSLSVTSEAMKRQL